jgi:hypothetical protein
LLDGLIMRHNSAVNGGAIYNESGSFRTENLILAENHATSTGGAVYNSGSNTQFWHSTVYGNTAPIPAVFTTKAAALP